MHFWRPPSRSNASPAPAGEEEKKGAALDAPAKIRGNAVDALKAHPGPVDTSRGAVTQATVTVSLRATRSTYLYAVVGGR